MARAFLDASPLAVIGLDRSGRVRTWNPAAERLFGWGRDEVVGRPLPIVPEADRSSFEHALRGVLAGEVVVGFEASHVRKDGSLTDVSISGAPVRGPAGRIDGTIAIVAELSGSRRTAREEARLRTLIEHASDIIMMIRPDGTIQYASPSTPRLLGYTGAEICGRPIFEFLHPDERERLAERVRRGFEAASPPTPVRYRFRHQDGSWLHLEGIGSLVGEGEGRALVVNARDVSDRHRAEREWQESEARYQCLFDQHPLPLWVYDRQTLKFLAVNDAAVAQYGYSREEFLAMSIEDIRPREDVAAVATIAHKHRPPGLRSAGTWRHLKKDGSMIYVDVHSADLPLGPWNARLVVSRDITDQVRLEEQLRQSQKMDALGRLAGGVAHDYNNLLFVISGYAEQLLRRIEDHPAREKVEGILKASDRAATLTRQLLTFSRQEAFRPQILNLNKVCTEMEKMLGRLLGEGVHLECVLDPGLRCTKGDPAQLEQVLMNLAVNARDAMPDGGTLTIETRNLEVDAAYAGGHVGTVPGDYVMLAVSDTGQGMSPGTRARIFEPFFTTKEAGKGTGLGLSIVYGIVKQSGGQISVYSEIGRGTTFKILFPRVAVGAEEAPSAAVAAPLPTGTETLLLVDDQEEVRSMARDALEEQGYKVLEARDGPEALAVAEEYGESIQLLVTDVALPRMTGDAVADRLLRSRPDLRILYMSGYTGRALAAQGSLGTEAEFLQKPFTLTTLLRRVRQMLDGPGDHRPQRG